MYLDGTAASASLHPMQQCEPGVGIERNPPTPTTGHESPTYLAPEQTQAKCFVQVGVKRKSLSIWERARVVTRCGPIL